MRGRLGGQDMSWPLPDHMELRVVGRRAAAKERIEVGWDKVKAANPDHSKLRLRRFKHEFIHLDRTPEGSAVRGMLVKSGRLPDEGYDEVRESLLNQLSWARNALNGYRSGEAAVSTIFHEETIKRGHVQCRFTLYPDGTVEKSEHLVSAHLPPFTPPDYVMVSTHWGAQRPDGTLDIGEQTGTMPVRRLRGQAPPKE
jgi:hypothetical protein